MARVQLVHPESATGTTKQLFDVVQQAFGGVPNVARLMANSPAVLNAFLQFSTAMSTGLLTEKLRDQLKLAASESNSCDYCLAAHSTIGKMVGLTPDEVQDARLGTSTDARTAALLRFACTKTEADHYG